MKKVIILSLLLCLVCSSCQKTGIHEVNQTVIMYNLTDNFYDSSELDQAIKSAASNEWDFWRLCDELGIEWYKVFRDALYTVIKTSNDTMLISSHEADPSPEFRSIVFSNKTAKEAIEKMQIGMSLQEVERADPRAKFDYRYAGRTDYPKYSFHFFEDGECFLIQYDLESELITIILRFTI